jgi:hypothetical protein
LEHAVGIPHFDPAEMALRGRIGAFVLHARHDPRETTAKARSAFLARFEREVDPEGVLPESERQRRAESAKKAHFARLALASARARSKRSRQQKIAPVATGAAAAGGQHSHAEPPAA